MSDKGNLWIYEAGRKPPEEALKAFNNGSFSGTDINPMWRIKKMTELFGPCGVGWFVEPVSMRAETYGETVMAIVDVNLYIKVDGEWSKPIFGTGGNLLVQATKSGVRPSDEGYKKAYTDAISNACKMLGLGADIWYSKDPDAYDPTSKYSDKYVRPMDESKLPDKKAAPAKLASTNADKGDVCAICGKPIQSTTGKNGQFVPADEVARTTLMKTGKLQCADCFASWLRVQRQAGVDV